MISRPRLVAVLVAVLALGTAACSNSESPSSKPAQTGTGTASVVNGVQQIVIITGADLRFHPSTLVVHRGTVRIVLKNAPVGGSGPPHNLQFLGLPTSDDVPTIQPGETQSVTFSAPAPGTYNFECSIHAAQGQTGKLIVKP